MVASQTSARRTAAESKDDEGTTYVVLRVDADLSLHEVGRASARQGVQAIKSVTKIEDGAHHEGTYKAIPISTWDSESNNLAIQTETKRISTFTVPNGQPKVSVTAL